MLENVNNKMIEEIKNIIVSSRNKIAYEVNNTMLLAYWNVGRIIVENEQNGNIKAEYGKQILKELSKELKQILGSGFSVSNLQYMRRFYLKYPKQQTLSVKLSWSHYCELLSIENDDERNFLSTNNNNIFNFLNHFTIHSYFIHIKFLPYLKLYY